MTDPQPATHASPSIVIVDGRPGAPDRRIEACLRREGLISIDTIDPASQDPHPGAVLVIPDARDEPPDRDGPVLWESALSDGETEVVEEPLVLTLLNTPQRLFRIAARKIVAASGSDLDPAIFDVVRGQKRDTEPLLAAIRQQAEVAARRLTAGPSDRWGPKHVAELLSWKGIQRSGVDRRVDELLDSLKPQLSSRSVPAPGDTSAFWTVAQRLLLDDAEESRALATERNRLLSNLEGRRSPAGGRREPPLRDIVRVWHLRLRLRGRPTVGDVRWPYPNWFLSSAARLAQGRSAASRRLMAALRRRATKLARWVAVGRRGSRVAVLPLDITLDLGLALQILGRGRLARALAADLSRAVEARQAGGRSSMRIPPGFRAPLLELLLNLAPTVRPLSQLAGGDAGLSIHCEPMTVNQTSMVSAGTRTLAVYETDAARARPAVVGKDHRWRLALRLFDFMRTNLTPPGLAGRYVGHAAPDQTLASSGFAAALLRRVARIAGTEFVWVDPWPSGVDFVICVRFDVDRALSHGDWSVRKAMCEDLGLQSSWHFRLATLDRDIIDEIANTTEVAWHADFWSDDYEWEQFRRAIEPMPVRGFSPHGGWSFEGDHGSGLVTRAQDLHLDWVCTDHTLSPQPGLALRAAGEPLVWFGKPISLDRDTAGDHFVGAQIVDRLLGLARRSGLVQPMNHPDLNGEELGTVLRELTRRTADEGLTWRSLTLGEVADWISVTRGGCLRIDFAQSENASEIAVSAARPVRAAVVNILSSKSRAGWSGDELSVNNYTASETNDGILHRFEIDLVGSATIHLR